MARVYLSGPMRGMPDHNFPAFHHAASILRDQGHDVLNPADSFDGKPGVSRADCLRHDIQLILIVDAVVVIDDWTNSPGARFEVAEAWSVSIPVYFLKGTQLVEIEEVSVTVPREDQYVNRIPLIGLSGFARAGKDEVARTLVEEKGWTRIAFADPLKQIAKELGWDGTKDEAGRRLLQSLGVAVRDHLSPDAWVQAAEDDIERIQGPVVITDVRFPNEVQMIRRRGGKMVRIMRPGTGAVNEHISEHAIDDDDCDLVLANDGSLADLQAAVLRYDEPDGPFRQLTRSRDDALYPVGTHA